MLSPRVPLGAGHFFFCPSPLPGPLIRLIRLRHLQQIMAIKGLLLTEAMFQFFTSQNDPPALTFQNNNFPCRDFI